MIAILEAYRAGLLKSDNWRTNISAGIIVGIVALPLAMAFAIASGAKPEQGLYTAIIAALLVGLFGGSRVQIAGPTGAFVVILANITAEYGISGLQTATLLAGLILITMGILRLGNIVKHIPDSVITGFTAGIGAIIFTSEWKDFFGLPIQTALDAHFYTKTTAALHALPSLDVATTLLAALSLALVIYSKKITRHIPGPLAAMAVATILQVIFQFENVATIGSVFGGIPQQLPSLQMPDVSLPTIALLIGPACSIALLGAIESLLSATAADVMTGTKHHSNQELIGQGLANLIAPVFGGFAATGAIARTATNIRSGGNAPIAAIVHSVFLILVVIALAPIAAYIPLCTLAAILFVVAYHMSNVPHFIHTVKTAAAYDVFILISVFLLTMFSDLIVAVSTGVALSIAQRMTRYAAGYTKTP